MCGNVTLFEKTQIHSLWSHWIQKRIMVIAMQVIGPRLIAKIFSNPCIDHCSSH